MHPFPFFLPPCAAFVLSRNIPFIFVVANLAKPSGGAGNSRFVPALLPVQPFPSLFHSLARTRLAEGGHRWLQTPECVPVPSSRRQEGSQGGELVFGGVDPNLYTGQITWTPVTQAGYWQIGIEE